MQANHGGIFLKHSGPKPCFNRTGTVILCKGGIFKYVLSLGTVVASLLLIAANVQSQDIFYVRAGATGARNGSSWDNAYETLPDTLVRGATFYISSGTYGGYTFDDAEEGAAVITIKKATVLDHGTDTGWIDIFGDGVATFTGSFSVTTGYLVIDGVSGGGPGNWMTGHGFVFTSPAGTNIQYINVVSGVSNLIVRHVYFHQTGDTEAFPVGAHGIYCAGTMNKSLFEYNYFDNLGGLPFLLRDGSQNIFQYNYTGNICGVSVKDMNQHCEALVLHDMDDVHFRWNYISECPSSGGFVKNNVQNSDSIRIYGNVFSNGFPIQCNTGSCSNWRIFNNTFHSFGGGPFGGDGSMSGLLFYNNIMYNASYIGPLEGNHDYNYFSRVSGLQCKMGASAHENICVGCSGGCDTATTTTNPFVNAGGSTPEDYRLATEINGHPGYDVCLLEACAGEKEYGIDAFGKFRGVDGVWDRGGYEFLGSIGTRGKKPMAPSNIRVD